MNPYSRLVARLNGKEIEERSGYYLDLVKKGVAGFIIFGGALETVRANLREFQNASDQPLIIASDLEQGLGQQIEGGTVFPPAMAIASAVKGVPREEASSILKKLYSAFAKEAHYTGINTILAPVLDINTNPDNPIIATRAFGEDPDTVSFFGCEMIKVLQRNRIAACGKHFPGHGDTQIDSHISLPVIGKELASLQKSEFVPFQRAINQGVSMIMLGHLSVPALDPSGRPASVSEKAVAHLRAQMGFRGIIITDAMNMGGIGQFTENEASRAALDAGVDIILHPSDPDAVASYLGKKDKGSKHRPKAPISFLPLSMENTEELREKGDGTDISSDFTAHQRLSDELATMAVFKESGNPFTLVKPFLILMNEEKVKKGEYLVNELRQRYPALECRWIFPGDDMPWSAILKDHDLIVSVFSQIRAWKGQTAGWLRKTIESVNGKAKIVISFGNPYVLSGVRHTRKIYAFWDSVSAQKAVVERLAH